MCVIANESILNQIQVKYSNPSSQFMLQFISFLVLLLFITSKHSCINCFQVHINILPMRLSSSILISKHDNIIGYGL